MIEMKISYMGDKHCEITHGPSDSKIETDAPKDNQGRGEKFSPTDLMGAALGSCILTTMAIVAERDGIPFEGATAKVGKEMNPQPRRIARLATEIIMPKGLASDVRRKLEGAARACPVHKSLLPEIDAPIIFIYQD